MTTQDIGWRDDATGLMTGGYSPAMAANDAEAGIAPPDQPGPDNAEPDQPDEAAPEPGERSVPVPQLRAGDIARPHASAAYRQVAAVEPEVSTTDPTPRRYTILWRGGGTTTPYTGDHYLVAEEQTASQWREQAARNAAAARTSADLRHLAARWARGELPPPVHHATLHIVVDTPAEVEAAAATLGVQVQRRERTVACELEPGDGRGAVHLGVSAMLPKEEWPEARS